METKRCLMSYPIVFCYRHKVQCNMSNIENRSDTLLTLEVYRRTNRAIYNIQPLLLGVSGLVFINIQITKDTWNKVVTNIRCLVLLTSPDTQVMSHGILTPISVSQPLSILSCPNTLPIQIIHVPVHVVPYRGLLSICFGELSAKHWCKT